MKKKKKFIKKFMDKFTGRFKNVTLNFLALL